MGHPHFGDADREIEVPITPDAETWRSMAPEAREAFLAEAQSALQHNARLRRQGGPSISDLLGPDLVIADHQPRFPRGGAEASGIRELLAQLRAVVEELARRLAELEARLREG